MLGDSQETLYARQFHRAISDEKYMSRLGYGAGWESRVHDDRAKFKAYGIDFNAYFTQIEGGVRLALRIMQGDEIDKTDEMDLTFDPETAKEGKFSELFVQGILENMVIQSIRTLHRK